MLFPVPLQIGCEWFLWSEKPAQASMAVGGFAHVPGSRLVQLGWLGWDGGLSSAEAHVVGEVILATGRAGPTRQVLHALCLYHSCCYPVGQSKRMNESRVKRWKNSLHLVLGGVAKSPCRGYSERDGKIDCGHCCKQRATLLSFSHFLCLSGIL